jgi:transglutaminase-like putative cysteine protease
MTNDDQTCLDYRVLVKPKTTVYEYETIGGFVNHFAVNEPHDELDIVAESVVETVARNLFGTLDLVSKDHNPNPSEEYRKTHAEFLYESHFVQILSEITEVADLVLKNSQGNTAQFVLNLKEHLFKSFSYQANLTNVHSLLHEVLELKAGVCQDFSHLMIACCRAAGLPTRYVSGYLYLGESDDRLRGTEATHAWVEVLMPDQTWLAVDPTNNILADERYVKVHVGRDYGDVTPIKGVFVGYGTKSMDVTVAVKAFSSV